MVSELRTLDRIDWSESLCCIFGKTHHIYQVFLPGPPNGYRKLSQIKFIKM